MLSQTHDGFTTGDHLVHFFDTDDALVSVVASYLSAAVLDGDAAVIIATRAHAKLFRSALEAAGVDTEEATRHGALLFRDAADTLARFTIEGRVDGTAFEEVVGGLVAEATAGGRPVRAYGEMVALLWAEGNVSGAIDLERMWNDLGAVLPFTLFCAYPLQLFSDPPGDEAFADVCHLHSTVVAGAPMAPGSDATRRFARTLQAPKQARRFVTETLHSWGRGQLSDDAVLIVTELATNAVVHGQSDVAIGLARLERGVRIFVGDRSDAHLAPGGFDLTASSGRGLRMVGALGRSWGHEVVAGGKVVWVDLTGERQHASVPPPA